MFAQYGCSIDRNVIDCVCLTALSYHSKQLVALPTLSAIGAQGVKFDSPAVGQLKEVIPRVVLILSYFYFIYFLSPPLFPVCPCILHELSLLIG